MMSDFGTIIGFVGLMMVKLLDAVAPFDCLG